MISAEEAGDTERRGARSAFGVLRDNAKAHICQAKKRGAATLRERLETDPFYAVNCARANLTPDPPVKQQNRPSCGHRRQSRIQLEAIDLEGAMIEFSFLLALYCFSFGCWNSPTLRRNSSMASPRRSAPPSQMHRGSTGHRSAASLGGISWTPPAAPPPVRP